jgi:small-conductance mechanosensitive channel
LMIYLIAQLNGIREIAALIAIIGVNVSMILFGWLQEKYTEPGDGQFLPFLFGSIAGAIPWLIVLFYIIGPKAPSTVQIPGFVYGIVISLFLLFNCFAIVQYRQYKAMGKWADYLRGEKVYIILSFTAKSLLAWQLFASVLASSQ